nr:MAG TPA: hypothetical protein [Caudoviricetes sp.]
MQIKKKKTPPARQRQESESACQMASQIIQLQSSKAVGWTHWVG